MGKVDLNKKQKKESLLNTAFSLFTSKGFQNTSISDIVKDSSILLIAGLGVAIMVYTQLLLKAFVNYYNTFLYDEIIFDDDDDEYFYIELDDNEDEVEKDEDENWYSRISKRIL